MSLDLSNSFTFFITMFNNPIKYKKENHQLHFVIYLML